MITVLLAIALGFVLLAEFIDGSTNKFGARYFLYFGGELS